MKNSDVAINYSGCQLSKFDIFSWVIIPLTRFEDLLNVRHKTDHKARLFSSGQDLLMSCKDSFQIKANLFLLW